MLGFSNKSWTVTDKLSLRPQIVDGLGVGDVGPVVLSDRKVLGQSGIVVVVVPRVNSEFDLSRMHVISKGFVFMKNADEVVEFIKTKTAEVISNPKDYKNDAQLTQLIEKRLARKLFKIIRREPLIVPVILDL